MRQIEFITPDQYYADNLNDWISPATPDWFANLQLGGQLTRTAKTCPSFVELFRDSYLLRAPCDITITYQGRDSNHDDIVSWVCAGSLPYVDSHNLHDQMGPEWSSKYVSIKLGLRTVPKASEPIKCMTLPLDYHKPRGPRLKSMMGIIPIHNQNFEMQLNMVTDLQELISNPEISIKVGEPLGLLYFPGGKPKVCSTCVPQAEYDTKYKYERVTWYGDFVRKTKGLIFK